MRNREPESLPIAAQLAAKKNTGVRAASLDFRSNPAYPALHSLWSLPRNGQAVPRIPALFLQGNTPAPQGACALQERSQETEIPRSYRASQTLPSELHNIIQDNAHKMKCNNSLLSFLQSSQCKCAFTLIHKYFLHSGRRWGAMVLRRLSPCAPCLCKHSWTHRLAEC